MKERRKLKRWDPLKIVYVFSNGTFLGYLEDLSLKGLRLMSEEPIHLRNDFQVSIELDAWKMSLDVYSIWDKKDRNYNYYYTGFNFLNLTPETIKQIKHLIVELENSDADTDDNQDIMSIYSLLN